MQSRVPHIHVTADGCNYFASARGAFGGADTADTGPVSAVSGRIMLTSNSGTVTVTVAKLLNIANPTDHKRIPADTGGHWRTLADTGIVLVFFF